METERLFVYGTLLPGFEPPYLTPLVRKLGDGIEATVTGILLDLGRYPGAIVDPSVVTSPASATPRHRRFESAWRNARCMMPLADSKSRVRGLLFDLPSDLAILRTLDRYEGYDAVRETGEFERILGLATLMDDSTVSTWIYGLSSVPARARLIPGGDYRHS